MDVPHMVWGSVQRPHRKQKALSSTNAISTLKERDMGDEGGAELNVEPVVVLLSSAVPSTTNETMALHP